MILELGADRRAENNLPCTEVCEQRLVNHKHRVLLMIPYMHRHILLLAFRVHQTRGCMFVPDEQRKRGKIFRNFLSCEVRMARLELAQENSHYPLKVARLPIPPLSQIKGQK